jgi:hypothetical protein
MLISHLVCSNHVLVVFFFFWLIFVCRLQKRTCRQNLLEQKLRKQFSPGISIDQGIACVLMLVASSYYLTFTMSSSINCT